MTDLLIHPSLGLPEMDEQHEYLFRLFDRIERSQGVSDVKSMRVLLDEIEGYLNFHFTGEEQLMRHYRFEGFASHQSDHEAAAAKFIQFLDDFDLGRLNPNALRIFLTGWLAEHAAVSDTVYAAWIKNRRAEIFT
jgi:hemerythrin-like metal-binding protein